MKQYILLLINTTTLVFALILNGLSGSAFFDGKTVGQISAQYDTLITPAGYAFSIWGLIYLMLVLFVGYQWYAWIKYKNDLELKRTGPWFALSNVANGLWMVAWLNENIGFSVILIFIILISLIILTIKLRLEIWDGPLSTIVFVWWPICFYLGWIIVASVVNTAVFLIALDWQGGFLSPVTWTILMIIIATLIYLFLLFKRNLREAALIGVWAFIAIAVRQWSMNSEIAISALLATGLLLATVSWHGYQNRVTSPMEKLKRKEL